MGVEEVARIERVVRGVDGAEYGCGKVWKRRKGQALLS
jgi:hypothetical protein